MSRHTSPIPECATSNCDASLNARVRIISPPGTQPNLEAKRRLSPAGNGSRCNYCKNFRLRQACFDVAKCGLSFNKASKTRPAKEKRAGARACKFHGRHFVNVNEIAKAGYVAALTASYATTFGDLSENWSLQPLSDSGRRKGVSSNIPNGDVHVRRENCTLLLPSPLKRQTRRTRTLASWTESSAFAKAMPPSICLVPAPHLTFLVLVLI